MQTSGLGEPSVPEKLLPAGLVWSGWVVLGLGVLGALAIPAFNIHTSGGPSVILAAGAGCALWLSPVYFTVSIAAILRGRRAGTRATRSELVQTALFALGTVALIALWVTSA